MLQVGKYDPLRDYLALHQDELTLTFEQIADLVGGLPSSAYRRPEWWSNNDERHVQAISWLASGHLVHGVDLANRRVTFIRR